MPFSRFVRHGRGEDYGGSSIYLLALRPTRCEFTHQRCPRPAGENPEFKPCAIQVFMAREDELSSPGAVMQRGRH
jgi:hypothetical protein